MTLIPERIEEIKSQLSYLRIIFAKTSGHSLDLIKSGDKTSFILAKASTRSLIDEATKLSQSLEAIEMPVTDNE